MASKNPSMNAKKLKMDIVDTRILDLPDDCLIPIFNNLSIFDLLSVYESHKHFRLAAKQSFLKNFKTLRIDQHRNLMVFVINGHPDWVDRLNFAKIFETFGDCIRSVQLQTNVSKNMTSILYLLSKHCAAHLKRLSLNCPAMNGRSVGDFSELFRNLEVLEVMSGPDNTTLWKILSFSENLKELMINDEKLRFSLLLPKIHSKLEKIFCRCNETDIPVESVLEFLRSHPNLQAFNVSKLCLATSECLDHLGNAEMLRVDLRSNFARENPSKIEWARLFELPHLRRLDLFFNYDIADSLSKVTSKPSTNVEILALNLHLLKNTFDLLDTFTFTNLKVLTISRLPNYSRLNGLVDPIFIQSLMRKLPSLEEIQFFYFGPERDAFENLLEMVKASKSIRTVVLLQRDVSHKNVSDLTALMRTKEEELSLNIPMNLVIGAHSGEIWRHDYFFMHF